MLNEEKIKIMNKLAMYEQGEGKKYLPSPHQMERQSLHYIHLLYMTFSTSHGEKLTDFNST